MRIKNAESLLSHGNVNGRMMVLDILEAGLEAADPYNNTMKLIRLEGEKLIFDGKKLDPSRYDTLAYDLPSYRHIYVIGSGKAAQRMAKAVEDILGHRITEGHINAKKGEGKYLRRIEVTEAGHPMPDEDSVEGAKRICEISRKAGENDLVINCTSGGMTALMAYPPPGVTLDELNRVTQMLYFECGAPIWEVARVRDVLSSIKAGRLEKMLEHADVVTISTSENWPKGRMERLLTDFSYEDATNVLKERKLWDRVPASVKNYLEKADPAYGPLSRREWKKIESKWHSFSVASGDVMLRRAKAKAEEMGVNAAILTHTLSAEAREVSIVMTSIASEVEDCSRPFKPPCALLSGGELVVTVGDATGLGGRNQEFALASAPYIEGNKRVVVASVDSDGTDGPTEMAGGIVDGETMVRAREVGIDVALELRNHNSNYALQKLGDAVYTGIQGTNVQDLRVVYISG